MQMTFKSVPLSGVELKMDENGTRKFKGYASVFNRVDAVGDTILPGAYKATLAKFGMPKMFFGHDWGLPIGKWTAAYEDEKGLVVEGELTPGNPQSDAVLAALKHGTVDGLSIGYRLKPGDFEERADGGRTIKNVSRLFEVSVVTFPCDDAARVTDVKSEDIDGIKTIRDLEGFLRDAGGFSKSVATSLVAKAKKLFANQRESEADEEKAKALFERISAFERSL